MLIVSMAVQVLLYCGALHYGANCPGDKFLTTIAKFFTFCFFAGCHIKDHLINTFTDFCDRLFTFDNGAAVNVHIFLLAQPERVVGSQFQAGRWFGSKCRTPASGEAKQIRAACDLPGNGNRVIAGVSIKTNPFAVTGSAYS